MKGYAPHPLFSARGASQRLTAILAAAALALAGAVATATPAKAQDDDLIRFLLGAAAIAVIVRAIDGNARVTYIDRWTLPGACLETVRVRGRHADVYHAGCLRRAGYRNLPHRCEVSLRTHDGRRVGYEANCLYRAGYRAEGRHWRGDQIRPREQRSWLPAHCSLNYRQGHQRLRGYDGHCLRQAGLRDLPRRCAMTARGGQVIYDADCLRNAGYRERRN